MDTTTRRRLQKSTIIGLILIVMIVFYFAIRCRCAVRGGGVTFTATQKRLTIYCRILYHIGIIGRGSGGGGCGIFGDTLTFTTRGYTVLRH